MYDTVGPSLRNRVPEGIVSVSLLRRGQACRGRGGSTIGPEVSMTLLAYIEKQAAARPN